MHRYIPVAAALLAATAAWGQTAAPAPPVAGVAAPPLTLADALRTAYRQSPLIAEGDAAVEAERGRLRQFGFRPNPEVDLFVENFAGPRPLNGIDQAETTLSFALPVELGGKRAARVALGEAGVAAAGARRQLGRAELARAVREAFAAAVAARELADVAAAELALARETEATVARLVDGGREPPLRLVTAQVERQAAEAAKAGATAEAEATRAQLAALIGRADTVFTPVGTAQLAPTGAAPGELPDIGVAAADAARARAQLRVERSLRTPDPRLTFGVRRLQSEGANALVAGVALPLPLFNRNGGAVAAAAAEVRRAEAVGARVALEQQARARAVQARITAAQARFDSLDRAAVPGAEEALRIARLGFAAGRFPFLDLLTAQRSLGAVRRGRIEAARDLAVAQAEHDRAAGIIPLQEVLP